MSEINTPSEAKAWLEARSVQEVECLIPDYAGTPRGKAVPASKFLSSLGTNKLRAPESIFAQTINGEFVENDLHSGVEQDMILAPDLSTLALLPWTSKPTASVVCDTSQEGRDIAEQSPRHVLKRVTQRFYDRGWQPIVAPEFEFFLLDTKHTEEGEPVPPLGFAGQRSTGADHMSVDVKNSFNGYFTELKDCCTLQGLPVESLVQEAGPGQFEMNLLHGDPIHIADQSFYFKRAARQIAQQNNLVATFLARPYADTYGSSMHLHQSVVDRETGKNIFANDDDTNSDALLSFIAGLQTYMPAVMLFLAPYVNSYGRFGTGFSVPANTNWGYENRTAGLRVPEGGAEARRIENRIAGSDANPYFVIAASLACGILGIEQELKPTAETKDLAGDTSETPSLPRHLLEAMDLLRESGPIVELLGKGFVETYLDVKQEEYRSYSDYLSPWEIKYLVHAV